MHGNVKHENIIAGHFFDNKNWKLTGFHRAAPISSDGEKADLNSVGVLLSQFIKKPNLTASLGQDYSQSLSKFKSKLI